MTDVVLRPWSLASARALVAGRPAATNDWAADYPLPETVDLLALLLAAHEVDGPLTGVPHWWAHQILLDAEVVGDVSFHGPPAASGRRVVEVGYAVVPSRRGRGVAGRAVAALLEQAWRDGADEVLAGTDEDNRASQAVLRRCGFRRRLSGDWAALRPVGAPVGRRA